MASLLRGLGRLGPGIVSGASDNDPTTVATLAVVGASTVYELGWLVLLVIPMLAIVQAIASHVGAVSRKGLEDCVNAFYGPVWASIVLLAILVVGILTLAADLEGGGAALQIMTGVDYRFFVVPYALAVGALLVFARYEDVRKWLRFVPLVFLTYAAAAFLTHPDWGAVVRGSLIPHMRFAGAEISGAIAILGTTLTSYAYVWETVEVAGKPPPIRRIGLVQAEAALGIVIAGLTFWFILVATGATLGVHHRHVETAQDAAMALQPFAGRYAAVLFAVGLFGSSLIAVPVIAATCAYVLAEMFGWRRSLDARFTEAPSFYIALVLSLVGGAAVALAGISPIRLLFMSSIAGGLATPLTLAFLMLVAHRGSARREHPLGPFLTAGGWSVTAVVTVSVVLYLIRVVQGAA